MAEQKKLSKRLRRKRLWARVSNVYAFLVYLFIYIPIIVMIIYSFNDQKNNYYWNGFTTEWYKKLFTDSDLVSYLGVSLIVAISATIISIVVGTIGALGLVRFSSISR